MQYYYTLATSIPERLRYRTAVEQYLKNMLSYCSTEELENPFLVEQIMAGEEFPYIEHEFELEEDTPTGWITNDPAQAAYIFQQILEDQIKNLIF